MRNKVGYIFFVFSLLSLTVEAGASAYKYAGEAIDKLIPSSDVSKSDCILRFDITELPDANITRFVGEIAFRKFGVLRYQTIFNEPYSMQIKQQMRERFRKLQRDVDSTYESRFCSEIEESPTDACIECSFVNKKRGAM